MSTRERVIDAIRHKQPDRCPVYGWFDQELAAMLAEKLHAESWDALLDALGVDRFCEVELDYDIPTDRSVKAREFVPDRFRKSDAFLSDDGHVFSVAPDGEEMPELLFCPLEEATSVKHLESYPFPLPSDVVEGGCRERIAAIRAGDAISQAALIQPFQFACMMRGGDNAVHDFDDHPDIAKFVYDKAYAFIKAQALVYANAGVDLVQINGTFADEEGVIQSLDAWHKLDQPRLADLISGVKSANSDCFVGIQSDGDFSAIIPELIEVGVDFVSPGNADLMNPLALRQQCGEKLALHGGMDAWSDFLMLSPGKIQKRVKKLIDRWGPGGLILGPTDMLGPEHPVENVIAFYEAVKG